jgi:hypothetical protein
VCIEKESHHKSDKVFLSESYQKQWVISIAHQKLKKIAGRKRVVIHMYGGCCICIYWWVEGNYSLSLKIAPLRFFVPKFKDCKLFAIGIFRNGSCLGVEEFALTHAGSIGCDAWVSRSPR